MRRFCRLNYFRRMLMNNIKELKMILFKASLTRVCNAESKLLD